MGSSCGEGAGGTGDVRLEFMHGRIVFVPSRLGVVHESGTGGDKPRPYTVPF